MFTPIPHEFAIGGVYMPPLLVASFLGIIAAVATTQLLNRYRLSRFFFLSSVGVFVVNSHLYRVNRYFL
jgi:hypothetical protein